MKGLKRSPGIWKLYEILKLTSFRVWKAWDKEKFFDQNAWTRGSPPGMEIQPHRLE